jgi:hypothetical protein
MWIMSFEKNRIQSWRQDNLFNTETMMIFSEIKNDILIMKDGWLRAILRVKGLNLDLKNYDEQQIILEQYKKFLNWLDFPIQILIRNSYLDLSDYLTYFRWNLENVENNILKAQWESYLKFLENIELQQGLIYNKDFYIIIPYYEAEDDNKQVNKSWFDKFLNILNAKDDIEKIVTRYRFFLKWKKSLETRIGLISDGLWSIWIDVEQLDTSEIINLLFRNYNPLIHASEADVA